MSNNQQPSLFDSKGLIAVFLVGVFFIYWQSHLAQKYKKPTSPQAAQVAGKAAEIQAATGAPISATSGSTKTSVKNTPPLDSSIAEKTLKYEGNNLSFDISNMGMGIRNAVIKSHTDRKGKPITLGVSLPDEPLPFSTGIAGQSKQVPFNIQKESETEFSGRAVVDGVSIQKKIVIDDQNYKVDVEISVDGFERGFEGITNHLIDRLQTIEQTSVFLPQFERQEFYFVTTNDYERVDIGSSEAFESNFSNVNVASINSHYFSLIFLDRSAVKPSLTALLDTQVKTARATLRHKPINADQVFKISYVGYIGPKGLNQLRKIDESLVEVINFGWFSSLARPILRVMQWFHGMVANWGVAIILLTILVRIVILPLHVMSYRSMEGMKKIQPALTALREKYKTEPQKLNQEMLVLMRTHKVNPVGGCLPMLLQFPVFLALYQVLGQSIELYQAPFMLWISDLSLKDKFYVLPVLMSLAMFLQMKLTPSTLDPTQQKVMMFMPVIFGVFTLALPSGLTLYIFISSVFGIVQQMYFMRNQAQINP